MSSSSTSHGYFESDSTQLSLSVGSSFEGVAGNSSANASQGISAGVSAVDTGMKAGMALAEARNAHAIVSFRYDNMGLPVEERSNEHVIKRTYDALGRRLSKDAIGITCWLWNGNVPLHEWTPSQSRNENGKIEENQKDLRTWLFEEESFVPLALFQDGKAYSIVTDHLGTPVEAYNEQGEEVWYRRLDMNGKVIEERSMLYTSYKDYIKIPFLFQGQYYDEEIKLAYNRFRYYDPNTGNYICQDPIDLQGGMQLYAYIHDSNSWIDPFGLSGRGGTLHRSIQDQLRDDLKGLGKSVEAEGQIKLKNGQSRFGDLVVRNDVGDIIEVHQIEDMRTRGGFRPSSRERGAIMDIREALGDDVRIVFHDKKGRVTLIDLDKADDWKVPSKKHRKNSYG